MLFYWIACLSKILGWAVLLWLSYNFIDIESDFFWWVALNVVGSGLLVWGSLFLIFYFISRFFSTTSNEQLAHRIYIYMMLVALYVMTNLSIIFLDFWNKTLALIILLLFIVLWFII